VKQVLQMSFGVDYEERCDFGNPGCMGGSSLAMAPAFVAEQVCDLVDLDSPLLIKQDVPNGIRYEGCQMSIPAAELWG
jgi:L-Ala-D/L-Glu epimerase